MDFFGREEKDAVDFGFTISMKGNIALDLLKTHPLIMAKDAGEDSAGRARLREAKTAEILEAVFALADGFVDEAAQRGWIKETTMDPMKAATEMGKKRGLIERMSFSKEVNKLVERITGEKENA